MKTIEVTDEMYDKLMELSKNLNDQDHLCTRMPYMIQLRTTVDVAAYPGCGEEIWVNCDGDELSTNEEIKEYLEDSNLEIDELMEFEIESKLHVIDDSWRTVEITQKDELDNFFFTRKALEKFCGENAKTHLTGVRNPELELVMTFLCELSGGKLHT